MKRKVLRNIARNNMRKAGIKKINRHMHDKMGNPIWRRFISG